MEKGLGINNEQNVGLDSGCREKGTCEPDFTMKFFAATQFQALDST
ncbi:MAG: hypothetical protein ABFR31_02905 [Thermodesulfobacteriota bacterium]